MMQQRQQNLLELTYCKQNEDLQQIKKHLTNYPKYFYNLKNNTTLVYDQNVIHAIHKDYVKVIKLPKPFVITDMAYNFEKNVLLFFTVESMLFVFFPIVNHLVPIKKDYKKIFLMEWIYGSPQAAHFFVAEQAGVHFYRFEDEKKNFKETKNISGKYHCFLYQPLGDILVGFPYGDCEVGNVFNFDPSRAKNWFRAGELQINFEKDQVIADRISRTKSFGLQSSKLCKQILSKRQTNEDYFIDCLRICNYSYICFYMASEGKLRLTPIDQFNHRKPITIKLPSDSLPLFNIVDNMLAVHLKNEKITFIYDVGASNFQTLVSPYPLVHQDPSISPSAIYNGQFLGRRILLPTGIISKWKINLRVIFHYIKNQMTIFQFLNNRSNSKMQIIRWLRENLFNLKLINLSRIWKQIFSKNEKGNHDQSDIVTIIELYSNLFYTLFIDPLTSKEALTNTLIECLRQCNEFRVKLPDQLEYLATELLLMTKKYQMLTYLCHHNIIKPNLKVFKLIFAEHEKNKDELLLTLSIDLASQNNSPKQLLPLLLKTHRLKEGKRFLKSNFDKFQVLEMLQAAKWIQNPEERLEFARFVRFFISQKFPSINMVYLDEAEKKLSLD